MSHEMADTFNGDFAKLVPKNDDARRLFTKTYVYIEDNKTFHFRFLDKDRPGIENTPALDEPLESSTDNETHSDVDVADEGVAAQISGHFILSFNRERRPELPHLGWRAGRGSSKLPANRGVDLLLAKPGHKLGTNFATVHMILSFNPSSGLLMLVGGSSKPVEYKIYDSWEKLYINEKCVLHRPSTKIRIGLCEYELEFIVEQKDRDAYCIGRDGFLKSFLPGDRVQHPVRRIPGDSCIVRGRFLELETRGSGAFGWISQGIDTKTGDFVAIKELRIGEVHKAEARAEVQMGNQFLDKAGLIPILGAMCEHGHTDICCDLERFFIFMPLAIADFTRDFWKMPELSLVIRLSLLREPLEGVKMLHAMGIMHRDIRRKNTLLLSFEPPRAVLCDYGKAIKATGSTDTVIGPIYTCAPDVWTTRRDGPYTSKIDLWAYGLEIAEVLGYRDGGNYLHITRSRHSLILEYLQAHSKKVIEDKPLADLASKLLAWKPEDRLSAEEALKHPCWLPIPRRLEEVKKHVGEIGEGSQTKKPQLQDTRSRHIKHKEKLLDP